MSGKPISDCVAAVSGYAKTIGALGQPGFAETFLACVADDVAVDLCSAFALDRSGAPSFLFAAARIPENSRFAQAASTVYAQGYWRADPAMAGLPRGSGCRAAGLVCQRWDTIPLGEYRTVCYENPGVVERVWIRGNGDAGLTLVGLYRTRVQGYFSPDELGRLARTADLLTAIAAKHGSLTRHTQPPRLAPDRTAVAQHLARLDPRLSLRETAVCAALLCGQSAKETATSLGIEPSSVVTYRKRAFLKLGVSSQFELARRYESLCPPS